MGCIVLNISYIDIYIALSRCEPNRSAFSAFQFQKKASLKGERDDERGIERMNARISSKSKLLTVPIES